MDFFHSSQVTSKNQIVDQRLTRTIAATEFLNFEALVLPCHSPVDPFVVVVWFTIMKISGCRI